MNKIFTYIKSRRDTMLLAAAILLLCIALFNPTIPVKHNIYTYLMVADISQSMNTKDMKINGKDATRMEYMQKMMHETISSLPCGTKVSIGLFAGVSVAALYHPIDVCENFAAIQDTIDHLDWRTGWSGNSRVRESLFSANRVIRAFPESAQVIFFTDGEESPRLHVFNTKDLMGFQGADGWLLVGIGSEEGAAIPKLSETNQVIGYWSNDSFAVQPGIAQISESNLGSRNESVALGLQDRYISKLASGYMRSIAKEIGAQYIVGDSLHTLLSAMKKQIPARRDVAPFDLHWILAALSGLLLIGAYISKHPVRDMLSTLRLYKKQLTKKKIDRESEIAHDNFSH